MFHLFLYSSSVALRVFEKASPTIEETLFGISGNSCDNSVIRKFNYTFLVMRYYIYTNKLNNKAITLPEFVNEIKKKICL